MRARILALGLILSLSPLFSTEKASVINYSWQDLFPDHLERVYIIMKDGVIFPYTSHYGSKVYISIGWFEEALRRYKNKNYSIKDIAVVFHNHRKNKNFGHEDWRQYGMLKSFGFDGRFLMYCHRTKEVYNIEDK